MECQVQATVGSEEFQVPRMLVFALARNANSTKASSKTMLEHASSTQLGLKAVPLS